MAIAATNTAGASRAPRGTKTLTQAFFAAADDIPEATRPMVIKAALTTIRDQLKNNRDKAKAAKASAKTKLAKAPAARRPKLAAVAKKAPAAKPVVKKVKAKPGRKPAAKASPAPVNGGDEE